MFHYKQEHGLLNKEHTLQEFIEILLYTLAYIMSFLQRVNTKNKTTETIEMPRKTKRMSTVHAQKHIHITQSAKEIHFM